MITRSTATLRGSKPHSIDFTDKVYACLTHQGRTLVEITRDRFVSFSYLLDTLRSMVPTIGGLCTLTVRNMTRGWRIERPFMLYPEPC